MSAIAIDTWLPGDNYTIAVDGATVGVFDKGSGPGVTSLGGGCGAPQNPKGAAANAGEDIVRAVDITILHSSPTATITITCSLTGSQIYAALGVDAVTVSIGDGTCARSVRCLLSQHFIHVRATPRPSLAFTKV